MSRERESSTSKHLEVAVSGSRAIHDRQYVWAILDYELTEWAIAGYEVSLRLGDASGVDSHAVAWARERQIAHTVYFASGAGYERAVSERQVLVENNVEVGWELKLASDWAKDGERAGTIRNSAMLHMADILIAIHDGSSTGTRDAMAQAKMRSVFIHYWTFPPVSAECLALGYTRKESA